MSAGFITDIPVSSPMISMRTILSGFSRSTFLSMFVAATSTISLVESAVNLFSTVTRNVSF